VTRLPSPSRALPAPQYPKRVRPKTYSIAVYFVVAVVVLQIGMLISVFYLRAMVVSVNVRPPTPVAKARPVAVVPEQNSIGPIAPNPATPQAHAPELPSLPGLAITARTPALLSVPSLSDKLEQVGTLNDEAQILLHQNDLKNASQVLSNAEDIDPRNPTTLKSLAETYYLMNDSVRAKEYWQRLVDLGPGVGTIYALAKDHVLLLDSTADANTLAQPSPLHLHREVYIDQVDKTPVETINGQPQFHLQTFLMRKDLRLPFDQKKLQVYVIFYQQMPDGRFQPDLSQHKGAFEDTFLFQHEKLREPFSVDYMMPTPGALEPDKSLAGEYYGFVIGIYYNKVLQDGRSEPSSLINRIALPEAIE
jgi:tetratricopeptide (TPR) repeat protein